MSPRQDAVNLEISIEQKPGATTATAVINGGVPGSGTKIREHWEGTGIVSGDFVSLEIYDREYGKHLAEWLVSIPVAAHHGRWAT